jgi:hypothetical protein
MLESEILQKMQGVSIEERIRIIEMILQSLKNELIQNRGLRLPLAKVPTVQLLAS